MLRIAKTSFAAFTLAAALATSPASAAIIANPTNSYSFPYLTGSLTGGQSVQYVGETFTAPISGDLTNFQFTLNSSSLNSLYGVVFAWNGTSPTTQLWRSANITGTAGLLDFSPTGVALTQGQSYVAFLSTFGLADNAGLATVGTCLTFVGCTSNSVPNLGTLITGRVFDDGTVFSPVINDSQDATFSATISAPVPEPATWAMMLVGFGAVGVAMRRSRKVRARIGHAV